MTKKSFSFKYNKTTKEGKLKVDKKTILIHFNKSKRTSSSHTGYGLNLI